MENNSLSRREFLQALFTGALAFHLPNKVPFLLPDNFEIFRSNENLEGILYSDNLTIYNLPLTDQFFYDKEKPIQKIQINENMVFGYRGEYVLRKGDFALTATILHHVTGESALPIAILDVGSIQHNEYERYKSGESFFQKDTTTLSEYTYSAEVYPNKIKNLLLGTLALLEYQEAEKGFTPRKRYSLLDIFDIPQRRYFPGYSTTGAAVRAGGICSASSLFAKSLLKLCDYTENYFLEKWGHFPEKYRDFVGPADERVTYENSDVAIDIFNGGHDFRWFFPEQEERYFLSPKVTLFSNGKPITENALENHDAWIVLTYSWVSEPPLSTLLRFRELLREYDRYRESGDISDLLQKGTVEDVEWDRGRLGEKIINLVYPA